MNRYKIIVAIVLFLTYSGFSQTISLDSCISLAIENNYKIKEAELNVQASEKVRKSAFTNYFPSISASAMAMRADHSLIEATIPETNLPVYDGNPVNLQTPTQFAYLPEMNLELLDYANFASLMAVQPIYSGGRIYNGNKLAKLGEEVSAYNFELAKNEVVVQTETFYWNIVSLNEKMNTLLKYKQLLENLKKDATVSYNAGLIQKSDVLKVELELNNVEANKLKLENGIAILKMAMAQHLGLDLHKQFSTEDTVFEVLPPSNYFENPGIALQNRSEYKMLQKSVEAENLQKKILVGEHLPQVAIGVQAFSFDIGNNTNNNALGFAMVSIPISDWWSGSHKLKEQKIKIEIAKNQLQNNSELLQLQIEQAYMNLLETYKLIEVAELSQKQAAENLKIEQDNFNAGIIGTSDLLEAQASFQESMDSLIDAKATYKIKLSEYEKALGHISF